MVQYKKDYPESIPIISVTGSLGINKQHTSEVSQKIAEKVLSSPTESVPRFGMLS